MANPPDDQNILIVPTYLAALAISPADAANAENFLPASGDFQSMPWRDTKNQVRQEAPYLSGERHPHPDPYARGGFVGLTLPVQFGLLLGDGVLGQRELALKVFDVAAETVDLLAGDFVGLLFDLDLIVER